MFIELFVVYNLLFHIFVLPINFMIMFKEFTLPLFQMVANWTAARDKDKLTIGLVDLEHAFNPMWYF